MLPEHPSKGLAEDESSSRKTSQKTSMRVRHSKGPARKPAGRRVLSASVKITVTEAEHGDAWRALYFNNPFTEVTNRLLSDEINTPTTSLAVAAYTLMAVPQERTSGPQEYWDALVAHLAPLELAQGTGKGKGKGVQEGIYPATVPHYGQQAYSS